MGRVWQLNQNSEGVLKHALSENCYVFTTKTVSGGVFYMPAKGDLSGDTFEVEESDGETLTVIVSDAKGHGAGAWRTQQQVSEGVQNVKHAFVAGNVRQLEDVVFDLDSRLEGLNEQLALTVAYSSRNKDLRVLNFAENAVLLYDRSNARFIVTPESDINVDNGGKLGWLSMFRDSARQEIGRALRTPVRTVAKGDKLVLATDGVYGIDNEGELESSSSYLYFHIYYAIRYSPRTIVNSINGWASRNAAKRILEKDLRHEDDYTLVVLEYL
ncbi:MAG: SpoIIE family protein phosphatase [Candidatus Woesearchaeota archaeon]